MGRVKAGINDLIPDLLALARNRRQGKIGIFRAITIEHNKKIVILFLLVAVAMQKKGEGMTFSRPILLRWCERLPDDFRIVGATVDTCQAGKKNSSVERSNYSCAVEYIVEQNGPAPGWFPSDSN